MPMMWEVAGGVIIAAFVLFGIGTLAGRLSARIALRKAQKLRDVIASGELAGSGADSDLSKELKDDYAMTVQSIMGKCRWAEEFIAENNKEKLERTIKVCLEQARDIDDEFYRSAALHPIAELLLKAGEAVRAKDIIALISVDFMREKAEKLGDGKT